MPSKTTIISFILVSILLLSCKKENRFNYFNIEISVFDFYTGEAVSWIAFVEYKAKNSSTGKYETKTSFIGSGKGSGHIVKKRPNRSAPYKLRIKFDKKYENYPDFYDFDNAVETVNSGEHYRFFYSAKPTRRYKLILTNTNCSGPSDELHIHPDYLSDGVYYDFTGCQNQYEPVTNYGWTSFTKNEQVTFFVKSVKNGIIDSFYVHSNLSPDSITPIAINY